MYVCMYMYIYIYMCVCVYMYIYTDERILILKHEVILD